MSESTAGAPDPTEGEGEGMAALYAAVLATEALVVAALWLLGRFFS